jgi:hypothetical protein
MANITEEHLHHMAKRHHATMKKLDGIREKVAARLSGFVGTLETGTGAWLGGAIEGRTGGGTVMKVPMNLGIGALLLAAGHLDLAGDQWSSHLNNLGNGFVGSYVAATGYSFGKRWKETGKIFGGGGHPWTHPYEAGPGVSGTLSEAQMAEVVQRMHAAANAGVPG